MSNIVFMGTPQFSVPILKKIVEIYKEGELDIEFSQERERERESDRWLS